MTFVQTLAKAFRRWIRGRRLGTRLDTPCGKVFGADLPEVGERFILGRYGPAVVTDYDDYLGLCAVTCDSGFSDCITYELLGDLR